MTASNAGCPAWIVPTSIATMTACVVGGSPTGLLIQADSGALTKYPGDVQFHFDI